MYYVDEATITVRGGRGGNGKVAFFPRRGGPCGGNGGKGGDVYFQVDPQMTSLDMYASRDMYEAEHGQHGKSNRQKGTHGHDLILSVPPHTIIKDTDSGQTITLEKDSSPVLFCKGGRGGYGNNAFKSAVYQTPRKSTPGEFGEEKRIHLTHQLLADVGFVGLPNAGKSSLLNQLTAANVRTGAYPFTTREPNLGSMDGIILADIPGLIEGASSGKGLGTKFLKHISKVQLLIHCISAESQNIEKDYKTILHELSSYDPGLVHKQTLLVLTKHDILSPREIEKKISVMHQFHKNVMPVSVYDQESLHNIHSYISSKK